MPVQKKIVYFVGKDHLLERHLLFAQLHDEFHGLGECNITIIIAVYRNRRSVIVEDVNLLKW